jgi:hypothetical protein
MLFEGEKIEGRTWSVKVFGCVEGTEVDSEEEAHDFSSALSSPLIADGEGIYEYLIGCDCNSSIVESWVSSRARKAPGSGDLWWYYMHVVVSNLPSFLLAEFAGRRYLMEDVEGENKPSNF